MGTTILVGVFVVTGTFTEGLINFALKGEI